MSQDIEVTKFSDTLAKSLSSLYRAGGLALVFVFAGLILMLVGHFYESSVSIWIFAVGALTNLLCIGLFLYLQLREPVKAMRTLKKNQEFVDSVQLVAISLTDTISKAQSLMFKNSESISKILQEMAPLLAQFPIINAIDFSVAQDTNATILNTTERSLEIVGDIKQALIDADATNLKKYSDDLRDVTDLLKDALRADNKLVSVPDYKQISADLKSDLADLTETFLTLQLTVLKYSDMLDTNLDRVASIVQSVPFLGQQAENLGMRRAQGLSRQMRSLVTRSADVTNNLETAIATGAFEEIASCLKELQEIGRQLNTLLQTSTTSGIQDTEMM
jgi:hypothetical protein